MQDARPSNILYGFTCFIYTFVVAVAVPQGKIKHLWSKRNVKCHFTQKVAMGNKPKPVLFKAGVCDQ